MSKTYFTQTLRGDFYTLDVQQDALKPINPSGITVDREPLDDVLSSSKSVPQDIPKSSESRPVAAHSEGDLQIMGLHVPIRVANRLHLAPRNAEDLQSLFQRLGSPKSAEHIVESFFDLPGHPLTAQGVWVSRRNDEDTVRFTLSDSLMLVQDLVVSGRWHLAQLLQSSEPSKGIDDLVHLFDISTKRLTYESGLILDCTELPVSAKMVVVLQIRGTVDLKPLYGLDFTRANSKVAEAFLASGIDSYPFRCAPAPGYDKVPAAFTAVFTQTARAQIKALSTGDPEAKAECRLDPAMQTEIRRLETEFQDKHWKTLAAAHPHLFAIYTSQKRVYLSDTARHAFDLVRHLGLKQPLAIVSLAPTIDLPTSNLVIDMTADAHRFWKMDLSIHHPDVQGLIGPFSGIVDSGCNGGVSYLDDISAGPLRALPSIMTQSQVASGQSQDMHTVFGSVIIGDAVQYTGIPVTFPLNTGTGATPLIGQQVIQRGKLETVHTTAKFIPN